MRRLQKTLQDLLLEMINSKPGDQIEVIADTETIEKFKKILLAFNQKIIKIEENKIVYIRS